MARHDHKTVDDELRQWRLDEDDLVVDRDGKKLGTAEAFLPENPPDGRPDYLLVEKGLFHTRRLYVPVDQIASIADGTIQLKVTGEEAVANGWDQAPKGIDLSID